tara:strand:- start:334 stop:1461 length:1128 start_codon:yes stop_codon:yes gene_type:complete
MKHDFQQSMINTPFIKSFNSTTKVLKSYLDPQQVSYLILYVTNRCNFRCNFCFYGEEIEKGKKPDELTLDELINISRKIGPLIQLSLTGGEPFLRNDFKEITSAFIQNTNVKYVTIPTNASMPKRMVEYLEWLLPRYPSTNFRLTFSIEAIGKEHDDIRSMPGSFEKIRESYSAISPIRKRYGNLVLDSNSVFTARTESSLLKTLRILDNEFDFDNLSITYARGDVPKPELKHTTEKKYIQINEFLQSRMRKKEKRSLYQVWRAVNDVSRDNLMKTVFDDEFVTPCVAGRKLVVLSETGEVLPCEILGKSLGNIRDHDYNLKRLLKKLSNQKFVKWIVDSKCKCSFECALAANVIWNIKTQPKLINSVINNIVKK